MTVLGRNDRFLHDIAATKFLRPDLGELLSAIKPQTGENRSAMTVPIAPSDSPDDRMIFEAPLDPATRFYLPAYRVATQRSGAGEELRVRFSKGAAGATLEVVLEPYAAEGVLEAAPDAKPLDHTVSAVLVVEPAELAGARRELEFSEVQQVDGGTRIALTVSAATEINDLFWALTRPENRARLVVRRLIDVALPVTITRELPRPPRIDIFATEVSPVVLDAGLAISPRILKFEPVRRDDPLHDPDPAVVHRTPVDEAVLNGTVLDALVRDVAFRGPLFADVAVPQPEPAPEPVPDPEPPPADAPMRFVGRLRGRDGGLGRIRDGVIIETLPSTKPGTVGPLGPGPEVETVVLYRRTTRSVEVVPAPQPFVFPPGLGSVFVGVGATGDPGALVLDQLEFDGAFHSYYRSSARPEVAYYLPDAFKLARLPDRPRAPFMSVRFDSADGTVDQTAATVVLAAAAWVNPRRLADAAGRIAAKASPGSPGATVELQPLIADSERLTLRMALPGEAAQEMPGAVIDLRTVLRVGFELPLGRFQRMFDALQGGGAAMVGGEVEVRLDHPDRPAEKVPFLARFDDLAGTAVELELGQRTGDDGFDAVLTNVAESPVRVDAVRASVAGTPVAVEGAPAADAAPLAPSESLTLRLAAGERPEIEADLTVIPDAEAIWDAVCDETTSFLQREVSVRTPSAMFNADHGILAIVVEIGPPGGGLTATVALEPPDHLEVKATVPLPFGDVVMRREDAGTYRYRVIAVRADRQTVSDWKTATSAVLFVVTGDVA
ncbi:hypothetical protein [Nocardioides sp.]|uniref:hypothetical protein n=1 Tax=Nocardioides sp. TaxID=35761 RepID=UPI002D7EF685|nr:hypothetical protein [Nocardioides sp.]